MKNQYPKISKILKVKINLSVLKFMYLTQFILDLSKLDLKIYVKVFPIEINRKFYNWIKAFCSVANQMFLAFFVTPDIVGVA